MMAVVGSEPFVTKTLILCCALICAAGCGGGGAGRGYSGVSGSTGFAGGYDRYQKKARLPLRPYNSLTLRQYS